MKKTAFVIACALAFAACANTDQALQRATAAQIGNNTNPNDVAVSNVKRGMMNVTWSATAPSGTYDCTSDDMVRQPLCTKK